MKRFSFLTVLILTLALTALADDFLISPGTAAGKITLGQSRPSVLKILGPPAGSYKVKAGVTADYWMSQSGKALRIYYTSGAVVQISVQSPRFHTAGGLSASSSLERFRTAYPGSGRIRFFVHGSGGGLVDYYDDASAGIALEVAAPASDRPSFEPIAIVVHRRGQKVIAEPDEKPLGASSPYR